MASESDARGVSVPALIAFACWLASGGLLETLHAFKAPSYLEDSLRREMWTLAHAHGASLALAWFAIASLLRARVPASSLVAWGERLFGAGALLVPFGFLLGGAWHPESDPGFGILLVPLGLTCCLLGLIAWIVAARVRML